MAGCRPFDHHEIPLLLAELRGRWRARDRALVVVGCNSGFRISELLSLRVGDVFARGRMLARVRVERAAMKGGKASRTVLLNKAARVALAGWLRVMFSRGLVGVDQYLWQSQAGGNRPISRRQAVRIVGRAARTLGLEGGIGTHSLRKTFAWAVYEREKRLYAKDFSRELPIRVVMKALGHRSVDVTERYLGLDEAQVDEAVESLNIGMESYGEAI
ncbi:tyrosine-type recombinase/integrase [Desulfocurvus sp. DL9XJH121]